MPIADSTIHDLGRRRRYGVLAICCTSLLLVSMDNTIITVALPAINRSFNASVTGLQWAVDAYLLTLASLLLLSGSVADRFGRRRIFRIGLLVFVLGSAACSVAPDIGWLIAARVAQAVGGSMLNPVAMSIIVGVFTNPRERAKAIGLWGSVFGVSLALGPVLGGVLTQHVGWRSIFWINVPIGLLAIALATRFVPESRAAHPRRLDPVGQVLVILTLGSFVYGLIEGANHGWAAPDIVAAFALAVVGLIALLGYERRRREPLIELEFFRSVPFSAAVITGVIAFAAFAGFLFVTTLYLQETRGYPPMAAGLFLLPLAVAVMISAPVSGRLVARYGARPSLCLAGLCTAGGAAMLVNLSPDTSLLQLHVAFFVFGIGAGMVNSPITNSAVSGMPHDRSGVAAATATTSRQVGQSLGVALGGSMIGGFPAMNGTGFADSTHAVWWLLVGLGGVILFLGVAATGRWATSRQPSRSL